MNKLLATSANVASHSFAGMLFIAATHNSAELISAQGHAAHISKREWPPCYQQERPLRKNMHREYNRTRAKRKNKIGR